MEITFLKDHLDHTAGDNATVTTGRGNYLISCNVAVKKIPKPITPPGSKPKSFAPKQNTAPPAPRKNEEPKDEDFDL